MSLERSSRATILVIEDEPPVARVLIEALESSGYRVWHAADGAEARDLLGRAQPDLILLDLILPDIDGLVLCDALRSQVQVPIVICSGTYRRNDPILGLKLGADDFIHKPFQVDELLARVEANLRRSRPRAKPREPETLRAGGLVVDARRRRVLLGDEPLPLTPTEYKLVVALAAWPEHVVSRDDLARGVWGYADASSSRTIDVHVRRLRQKLSARLLGPQIVAVRGSGYKLVPGEAPATAGQAPARASQAPATASEAPATASV